VITCPSNITVNNDAGVCGATVLFSVTATDNCSATVVSIPASGSLFPIGTTTVNSVATDAAGNTATCSFTVTVNDNESPVITCPSNITVNNDAGVCGATLTFSVTPTDNCSATVVSTPASGSLFPIGITTVNSVATDAAGNTAACSFTVTVNDNENPVITCPSNITVNSDPGVCGAIVSFAVTATDNCGATVTTTAASGDLFPVGTTTVDAAATDMSGNASVCSFTVTVVDDEMPVITCPGNITQNTDPGTCGAVVTFVVTAGDNCSASVVSTPASGSVFPVGTTTVNSVATDPSGNSVTCSFTVTVVDNEFPVLYCPAAVNANTDPGACGATVTYNVPATDNCAVQVVLTPPSGSFFGVGSTPVTATATDASGNVSTCIFPVIVTDNEMPVAQCPGDITVSNDPGFCGAVVLFTVGATDNCMVNVVSNPVRGSFFPVGSTTVAVEATDAAGNVATCDFKVTVVDSEAPVFSNCPADMHINLVNACDTAVSWTPPAVADNCSATLTGNFNPGDVFAIGSTEVTYTATDPAGNVSVCSFHVIVNDTVQPEIHNCPNDTLVAMNPFTGMAVVNWIEPTASDNCRFTFTGNFHSGDTFPVGVTNVIYGVVDGSGNFTTCTFSITVTNTTAVVNVSGAEQVQVYPNPFTQQLTISTGTGNGQEKYYRIYTIEGKELMRGEFTGSEKSLTMDAYAAGWYILEIVMPDGSKAIRQLIKN
jgi:hypothetical protein